MSLKKSLGEIEILFTLLVLHHRGRQGQFTLAHLLEHLFECGAWVYFEFDPKPVSDQLQVIGGNTAMLIVRHKVDRRPIAIHPNIHQGMGFEPGCFLGRKVKLKGWCRRFCCVYRDKTNQRHDD